MFSVERWPSDPLGSLAAWRYGLHSAAGRSDRESVHDEIRFFIRAGDAIAGPLSSDALRKAARDGELATTTPARLSGTDFWAPLEAWAPLAPPADAESAAPLGDATLSDELPPELAAAPNEVVDLLLFSVHDADRSFGWMSGEKIRRAVESGRYADATIAMAGDGARYPLRLLFGSPPEASMPSLPGGGPPVSFANIAELTMRCPTCLERIALTADVCPECDETTVVASSPGSTSRPSIPDDRPDATWLEMHWRPLVTMGSIMMLVCFGVALRYLAPLRWFPPRAAASHKTTINSSCASACWPGEACQVGQCVWQASNDVRHITPDPIVAGPFALPKDMSDAIPLDGERFAVSILTGTEIRNARNGAVVSLVSEAPQSRRLFRVGNAIYASAPQRVYVIDAVSTHLLKTIEVGSPVSSISVGASGHRALASLPNAHAVAILAIEFHAEIDRIQFGDDPVGPVGADDTGKRALTTTGQVPLPGLRDPPGGAVYAFDPSRLASKQDRVRASVLGNPVSVLMTPDGEASYVVTRAESSLVPLEWLPSGAVREKERIPTCKEPEQIELVRRERRAIVRCDEGRALEVFDIASGKRLKHIALNARAVDMAITPDGEQAIVALAEGSGWIGIVDLRSYSLKLVPLSAEPTRVRLSPDGGTALVLSDRSKVAWVLR